MSSSAQPAEPPLRRALRAPDRALQILEQRALFEAGAFFASAPLLRAVGRGDRHPVLVLPGFTGGDSSTVPLRALIRSWGYWAHGWRLGSNLGPTTEIVDGMRDRLVALHARHGCKVSLVGWSLGGLYARHLARTSPELVRDVITLGSPLQMAEGDRSAASPIADRLHLTYDERYAHVADHERGPLPVPSTSIYSRTDGVVRWQVCLDVVDDRHENVQVQGSHSGLGLNPAAVYVVADRLAQPDGTWRPFRAPVWLRGLYPPAPSWRTEG
jgi:pimeloyl-ACP methyl ester carboxylesterase